MLPLSSSGPSAGKTFFPSERRESNSFHCRNHATHLFVTESHEMNFQLFSRRIHFNNPNVIEISVCFAFSFHFLHLFFSRSCHISSTKLRGGHDIHFGRSPMFICAQTALSLFTYTYMKFLSFLTQRLSFCSTNVVKVQVSSSLKEIKNFESRAGIDPGMINLQSPTLTTRPPRIRCRERE